MGAELGRVRREAPIDGGPGKGATIGARSPPHRLPGASRLYLLIGLLLAAGAAGLVGAAVAKSPVAPGVDPGHWLSIAYPYVGLPTAPDPTDRILFYPPLLFPILGGLALAVGPLLAVDLVAVGLFLAYGLSVVHLGRRYLLAGPFQVTLVALALFSGPILQMVFWGGYPNLLGFVLMNEALVFLLAFVRRPTFLNALAVYGFASLTYLAHELSFTALILAVAGSLAFLLLFRKIQWRFLWAKEHLAGLALLGGTVAVYAAVSATLHVPHANYVNANPSAYFVDQLGELFIPLAHDPILPYFGAGIFLDSLGLALVMAIAPVAALLALAAARSVGPGRIDTRLLIATGWLTTAIALPGLGYLAHVETDYSRFLYFLPLPFFLLVLTSLERATLSSWVPAPVTATADRRAPPGLGGHHPSGAPSPALFPWITGAAVTVIVFLLVAGVAVPVVGNNEAAATASAHDHAFLDAEQWLHDVPGPGSVLTVASAARWTEALSLRNAYTVGPVWLLFDPFQITDAQESYWALSASKVLTNGQVALSVSGIATPVFSQAPMYTAYVEGIPFPVLRVLPGTLEVTASGALGTGTYPCTNSGPPQLQAGSNATPFLEANFTCSVATVNEIGTTPPDGTARVELQVLPMLGERVRSVSFDLGPPPVDSPILATDQPAGISFSGASFTWNVSGKLGQYPNRITVDSTGTFSPTPATALPAGRTQPNIWNLSFADVNGSKPFEVLWTLTSAGSSNPTHSLPSAFDSAQFLSDRGIRYLLWPNISHANSELTYFSATFGFLPVFANTEWTILRAP